MSFHLGGLRYQVVEHLIITDPVYGKENENTTGDECATDLVYEDIVPVECVLFSTVGLVI